MEAKEEEAEDGDKGVFFEEDATYYRDTDPQQRPANVLLKKIEDAKAEAMAEARQGLLPALSPPSMPAVPAVAVAPVAPSQTPPPASIQNTATWSINRLFSWIPGFRTPEATPPKQLTAQVAAEIKQSLTPTETENSTQMTPIRAKKPAKKPAKNSAKKTARKRDGQASDRGLIVKRVLKGVAQEEKPKAKAWVKDTMKKIEAGSATIGNKRKLLEQGMKMKDLGEIPARLPWQSSGTYGLQDAFFDYSSDEDVDVPDYYVLDMLAKGKPQRKRRKIRTNLYPDDDVRSLNDMQSEDKVDTQGNPSSQIKLPADEVDTHGNSSSQIDLHPRPSHQPSPMFSNEDHVYQGGNVFQQNTTPTTPTRDREAIQKELKRTGHVEGTGTFCVPEGDSDSSDDSLSPEEPMTPVWTQSPPPAPTPAHATLPSPLTTTEDEDPVRLQRAKYTKHTPAKPSKLRQAIMPSPSAFSEGLDDEMPDAAPIDLSDTQLEAAVEEYVNDPSFLAKNAFAFGGSSVKLVYDEDDEDEEY
ncbi:uncharacterized protein BDR25DRAFT_301165 [Lindgomyces ingoldianus]|uniref:Uncharacterized protein n=1 Tax=Lindgomyces ingoldianus TaxID=673940 RepID=A0ACB6R8W6_9PLEO|nr:uncharacterized protein BDR25DRAFT_301165 [Lindgomyces ingoldianus]KAF2475532.1 hypothetical protein BDR25DRAFT_301165 [Lindgomyces ingoldianus]